MTASVFSRFCIGISWGAAFQWALLVTVVLAVFRTALAQSSELEASTVETSYEIYAGNKTPKEARTQAIDRAQAEAVRKAIGTLVQAERRSSTIETGEEVVNRFSQVVRTGASGRVVDYEVLEERRVERAGELFYQVRIRASVKPAKGRPDPGFEVKLRLNDADRIFVDRGSLEESDEIIAEIQTTKDSYLTLFVVTPDTLQVIWPNSRSRDTFVPADTTVEFPSPSRRGRDLLHVRVNVPEGRERVTERLVAVATKQKVPFREVPEYQVENGALTTAQASVQAFNRWLVEIPLGERAITSIAYDVRRAPQN